MNRKKIFCCILLAALLLAACGGVKATEAPTAAPVQQAEEVTLEFWNGFNAHEVDTLNQMIQKYWTPTHPNIKINAKGEMGPDQVLTAVSGGTPVDVAILWDPTNVKAWAKQGALLDLTPYIQKANVNPEDIFIPAGLEWVRQTDGKYYGLPFVNFNYGFYWNKELFRQAGLDPEKPPTTIQELEDYARKLTIVENGEIKQLGWSANGNYIDLVMAFGGSFYDKATGKITANDPKIVQALTWDLNLAKEFGLEKVNTYISGFAGAGDDPFMLGKLAMTIGGCWNVTFYEKAGVQLDYGVGPVPASDPAYYKSNDLETNPLIILNGTKHPNEAWEFLWFMASSPDVSREFANLVSNIPQVKAAMQDFSSEPKTMVFVDLSNSPNAHGWAPIPVVAFYSNEWATAIQQLYAGQGEPQAVLDTLTQNVQAEADK